MPDELTEQSTTAQDAVEDEILAAQVKNLYVLSHIGLIATIVNASIIFFVLRRVLPEPALGAWFVATIAVVLFRLILVLRYRKIGIRPSAARRWGRYFTAGLTVSGILWGSLAFFPISGEPALYQLFIAFVLGGMAAGAAATFSALRAGFFAFSFPALAPIMIKFFLLGDTLHYAMATMIILFFFLLWRVSSYAYQVNRTSLLLRFENRGIIESLTAAKRNLDQLNQNLMREIAAKEQAEAELKSQQRLLEKTVSERTSDLMRTNEQLKEGIEQRKRLEEDLARRNAELSDLNRELEAFSYSVAHDIRAPLRSVEGFGGILLRDFREKLDKTGTDFVLRILNSGRKMERIVDDLLRLSSIGGQELSITEVDLSGIVDEIALELSGKDPERKAEFVIQRGLAVSTDRNLIKIALENLMANAWKFTAHVTSARIEFGSTEVGDDNFFYIRDNGIGFDMQNADRLFLPFQRLHSEREFPGTGIGLATVSRVIRRLGGEIRADSAPGKGATFFFTLPDISSKKKTPPSISGPAADGES